MTRGWIKAFLVACALVLLAAALRHDLASWSARQGMARLGAGDVAGAEAAFRRAIGFGEPAAPLHFNLGVAHYRDHAHAPARGQFDLAIAAAASQPELRQAAHYNRGNSFYRQAESVSGRDRRAAIPLLRQAMDDYRQALALAPGDANARGNLDLAQARLRGLVSGLGGDKQDGRAKAGQGKAGEPAGASPPKDAGRSAGKSPPGDQAGSRSEGGDPPSSGGKPSRALTQKEVERLLNDARGRERPAGSLHGGGKLGPLSMPDKDW